jgi:lipopolysaccharide export system protein LptC
MLKWRTVLLIAVIAVMLAGFGIWSQRDGADLRVGAAPAQPGYYLKDAVVTETDATGAARFKLRAQQINQNPKDESIDLQQVQLDYRSDPDSLWLLTANHGHLVGGSRVIDFTGNVVIKPQAPSSNRVELQTETLSMDTANNIATAPGQVKFAMDGQLLNAVGLKYNLKRQTLQLESGLHGQFKSH